MLSFYQVGISSFLDCVLNGISAIGTAWSWFNGEEPNLYLIQVILGVEGAAVACPNIPSLSFSEIAEYIEKLQMPKTTHNLEKLPAELKCVRSWNMAIIQGTQLLLTTSSYGAADLVLNYLSWYTNMEACTPRPSLTKLLHCALGEYI